MLAVVADDPAVRGSLQFSLEIEGYEVRVFDDAGGDRVGERPACGTGARVVDRHGDGALRRVHPGLAGA